jgi:hypothetical protein
MTYAFVRFFQSPEAKFGIRRICRTNHAAMHWRTRKSKTLNPNGADLDRMVFRM